MPRFIFCSDSERGHTGFAQHGEMSLMTEGVIKNNPLLMGSGGLSNDNFTQRAGLFHNLSKNIRLQRSEMQEEQNRDPDTSSDEISPEDESSPVSYHNRKETTMPLQVRSF
jgi:hypothetical protein